jgi:hypothetical protein
MFEDVSLNRKCPRFNKMIGMLGDKERRKEIKANKA